jgi:cobalt-zinc-cadmium efflux system membrane fusion protein
MRLPSVVRIVPALLLAPASLSVACSSPAAATQVARDLPPAPPDGVVRIDDASRRYIVVQDIGGTAVGGTLRVPARVDFRDGAVSQVGAPFDGRVMAVHARIGDVVHAGAALVTLDCPEAAAARAAVDTAQASLREARTALEREHRMLDEGVGTERDKVAAETKVSELEAELARAQAGAAFVGEGTGTRVVLHAPASGTVIARRATEGMAVQQGGEPLVEIGNAAALWVVADVFERDLPMVHAGARARIELPSAPHPLDGLVVSIGTVVSTGLRTAPVRIELSGARGLRPGMFGRADMAVDSSTALTLPTEAVLVKGKDTVVYVEKTANTFERRAVSVAPPFNGRVRIISGLSAGERIVVHGALLLDGSAEQIL